jgi:SNF2 family DNA or RNA helicase
MKFGTVRLEGDTWIIECEPDVRAKVKRVFPEVDQRAGGQIRLSNNPENCRDLEWFLRRYPMKVVDSKRLKQGARQHIEEQAQVIALLSARRPPSAFELALPPRPYQNVAADLVQIKKGLLLADEPGVGKTVTSICPMSRPQHLPVLVVTLSHLPKQWERAINKFAPQLKVYILKTGRPDKEHLVPKKSKSFDPLIDEEPRLPDVIISNYHKLHGWAEKLGGVIRYVVFDECQELRISDSNKYAAAKYIADRAQLRLGLSATPIYNYGIEFFNVIECLLPGALGTRAEFVRERCGADMKRIVDPAAFGEYLRREGIMLLRTRRDVGQHIPRAQRVPKYIDCDTRELERIKGSAVELARTILAAQQSHRGEKFMASQEFNMLMRQATGIAKAPYVAEFVRLIKQTQKKVVLFGWHREVFSIWLEQLKEFNPRLYTGTESAKEKDEAALAFTEGDCDVLIISLRSGAGLDGLQEVCWTAVFGEIDWSPGVHEQCIGRLERDDQDQAVMAYFLLSEDGSDPIIADVLGLKAEQIEGVRRPADANIIEKLEVDPDHIKRLAQDYLRQVGVEAASHQVQAAA